MQPNLLISFNPWFAFAPAHLPPLSSIIGITAHLPCPALATRATSSPSFPALPHRQPFLPQAPPWSSVVAGSWQRHRSHGVIKRSMTANECYSLRLALVATSHRETPCHPRHICHAPLSIPFLLLLDVGDVVAKLSGVRLPVGGIWRSQPPTIRNRPPPAPIANLPANPASRGHHPSTQVRNCCGTKEREKHSRPNPPSPVIIDPRSDEGDTCPTQTKHSKSTKWNDGQQLTLGALGSTKIYIHSKSHTLIKGTHRVVDLVKIACKIPNWLPQLIVGASFLGILVN